jgi:hypothetical protein
MEDYGSAEKSLFSARPSSLSSGESSFFPLKLPTARGVSSVVTPLIKAGEKSKDDEADEEEVAAWESWEK